jgi:D-alanyl-D-alanine carboxypeptidase (penicillin-binding protein 5/6)
MSEFLCVKKGLFKRILAVSLGLLLMLSSVVFTAAAAPPPVPAPSSLLMDAATGTVLAENNAHELRTPASVTKVMTLLLAMEAMQAGLIRETDMVAVSARAAGMGGSQVYLAEGEKVSVHDLLAAIAIASGNDAAVALAEHIAGSEESFVARMNQRAGELGMNNTVFKNCTGLPANGHLTTAYDIALMSRELLKHRKIVEHTTIWMSSLRGGTFGLNNTNRLVRYYPGTTGLKTGSTAEAGYCIAATALRDGMELIAVTLGSPTSAERFDAASRLLDYGFATYTLTPAVPERLPMPVTVRLGERASVTAVIESERKVVLEKLQLANLQRIVTLEETVTAPVERGQRLGTLTLKSGDIVIAEIPMVAAESVPRLTVGRVFSALLRTLFMRR